MTKKELTSRKFIYSMLVFVTATVALFTGYAEFIEWSVTIMIALGIYNVVNIKEKIKNLGK